MSVNKIRIFFLRMTVIYLNRILTNPYIWKNNWTPYQAGQWEITYPAKLIGDNFRSVDRRHDPKHGIWNNPVCLVSSLTVRINQNLLKCRRLRSCKQNTLWHQIRMRENGSSFNFNFISLPNPAVDKNWVCRHHLLIMPHTMFRFIQTLY